ncbi:DEK1 [Symbiodinium natans]|uniref:DEK1 protein n=1 Tax=Symbiodinium natans TaxID=878477 RepID=A0A812USC2_9DINO|nr:DEK1 [Symbiodinium natans]
MDTQLVLPGQMQILSEAALASLPTDKSREGLEKGSELGGDGMTMRLPMPRISDEEFHEKLRNLELECQQLRDSKSQLEQENALLKAQMGRSLESSETTESRLKGSISVAETQHQVLRRRMRAMLEDQRRLVDELQQEIAQELSQLGRSQNSQSPPTSMSLQPEAPKPTLQSSSSLDTTSTLQARPSRPWSESRYLDSAPSSSLQRNSPREGTAPPEEDTPTRTLPVPVLQRPAAIRSSGTAGTASAPRASVSFSGAPQHFAPEELKSPREAVAPQEDDPPAPATRLASSGHPWSASHQSGPDMPEEDLNSPRLAPPEESVLLPSSAVTTRIGSSSPGPSPLQLSFTKGASSTRSGSDGSDMGSVEEAPPEDDSPPLSPISFHSPDGSAREGREGDLDDTHAEKPEPMMSKSPVQGSSGQADHAESSQKGDEKKQVLQEGVILMQRYDRKRSCFQLRLCNKKLANLNFTVDISKSVNLEFWVPPGKKTSNACNVRVPAGSEVELCQIGQVDPNQRKMVLSTNFTWVPQPPDRKLVQQQTAAEVKRRHDIANNLKTLGIVGSKLGSAAKIEEACSKRGISQFVDAEFFPDDAALFNDPSSQDHPSIIWKRPSEFCKGEIRVFSDSIVPCDIHQGALGDCWYLAALAALAEQPELIRGLFSSEHHSSVGVYEVVCFKNGQLTRVIIDDLIPCSPTTGKPCYAHVNVENEGTTVNELWVALLEKAWAKLHGSYEQIEGGLPYQALMDLLGVAGKQYQLKGQQPSGFTTPDSFFQELNKFDMSGYLMVAGTSGTDNLTKGAGKAPLDGLVPGHAYTLLTVREACGIRLLRLRNPWGDHEWTGDWSDKSPLWTDRTKAAFEVEVDEHDGAFWMSDADFLKHFSSVGVAFFSRSWTISRTRLTTIGAPMCNQLLRLKVQSAAGGFLSLIQSDHKIKGTPEYMMLQFALYGPLSPDREPRKVLQSHMSDMRELVEELPDERLEPGEYFIAIWTPDKEKLRHMTFVLQLDGGGRDAGRSRHVVYPTPIDEQQMDPGPRYGARSASWSSQLKKLAQTTI